MHPYIATPSFAHFQHSIAALCPIYYSFALACSRTLTTHPALRQLALMSLLYYL